jgi:outer membrane protein OmpA-like peptidoglycan-associated protein
MKRWSTVGVHNGVLLTRSMRLFPVLFASLLLSSSTSIAQQHFVKLPPQVNVEGQSELAPVISADGKTLYFTRSRMGADAETVFDIWRTEISDDTQYSLSQIIGGNLSSRFGIAVTSISPDNNVLYLMGKLYEATPPDERIYRSVQSRNGWATPHPVKIKSLRPRGTFTDYSFGPDQRTLVMSIDRDSSMGGRDLYISFYSEQEDAWSEPLWLGTRVNSTYNELTPFLAPDGKTLYFSSERPNGIGECDVYRVTRKDDSWQNWTYPENLGPSVNRAGRTMYYTEDAKGEYAYFVWRKDQRSYTDIFRAKLEQKKSIPTVLVDGDVIDERGRPLEAAVRYTSSERQLLGTARSNPLTGAFALTLPGNADYTITADLVGYESNRVELSLGAIETNVRTEITLRSLKVGSAARLSNIFFETDKSVLYSSSFVELDRLFELMKDDPKMVISVEGHTDDVGTPEHNEALSLARANAVKDYLIAKGIASSRVRTEGFGSARPQVQNLSEADRAMNRRVEFKILARSAD